MTLSSVRDEKRVLRGITLYPHVRHTCPSGVREGDGIIGSGND